MDEINLETKTRSTCSEEETADLLSLAGTFILYLLLTRFRSAVNLGKGRSDIVRARETLSGVTQCLLDTTVQLYT